MIKDDVYLWLWSINGVGNRTIEIIEECLDLNNIFDISNEDIYNIKGIPLKTKENIVKCKSYAYLDNLKNNIYKNNINYITLNNNKYPKKLKNIYSPPYVLYYQGNIDILNDFSIGVVGSRKPTPYGIWCAKNMSEELSNCDINIVSGLAMGIDQNSHIGCISGKAKTVAVLGASLDKPHSKQTQHIVDHILKDGGVLLSEFNLGYPTTASNFPRRNRLISGLSDGVLIIEAASRSGALITADFALEQGKNIFAVPGNITSNMSRGCHKIIKEGAKLVESIQDILEEYTNISIKNESNLKKYGNIDLNDDQREIVEVLRRYGNLYIDQICDYSKMNIQNVNSILSILEIGGIVEEVSNKIYSVNI